MNDTRTRTKARTSIRATLALVIGLSGVALTARTADADDDTITVEVTVVDDHGHPFHPGQAGVIACPVEGWAVPCTDLVSGNDFNGDGTVQLQVKHDVDYYVNGFAMNTGWKNPGYIAADGTTFHFSPLAEGTGAQMSDFHATFVVAKPKDPPKHPESIELHLRVVDRNGLPLPAGTASALLTCLTPSGDPTNPQAVCEPWTFAPADAHGNVRLRVNKDSAYVFGGATSCPGIPFAGVGDEVVIAKSAALPRGTTFHVNPPSCP